MPALDTLRPHLARALSLAADLKLNQLRSVIEALELGSVAAALVDRRGRLLVSSALFDTTLGEDAWSTSRRLRFKDEHADASFAATLATAPRIIGASFPARRGPADRALAVHMLPMARDSPGLSRLDGFLLLAASGANKAMLNADLLRLMFDLTPAEAKLARRLVDGDTLNQAAAAQGISYGTARVHLRAVFVKTGVTSQAALLALLGRLTA